MAIQSNFPAIKPSLLLDFANTKALDPRITFTRASTATYYDGVTTAKAEENLFLQSQTFENASWIATNVTVTANDTTAPDGTTTAEKLLETSATGTHRVYQDVTTTASTFTASFYAKPNGRDYVYIRIRDSGSIERHAYFNVTTGTVGTVETGLTASIVSVGSGWYRCIATLTTAFSGLQSVILGIASADNTNSYAGDITKGAYFWGAQLEQRSAVTAYTATTTQAITNYIPKLQSAASGVARFDNNPTTGESLGLLIEEQRTNLITYSSDFTTTWTTSNATVSANTVIAPDGTLTGDSIINTATSSQHYALQNVSIAANGTYTTSIYLKALGTTTVATIWLLNAATADRALVYFTFATGAVSSGSAGGTPFTSVSATATSVGNGWSRVTLTATSTGGAINLQTRIYPNDASTFTGDAYSGVFAWGAQLELGSFATSYIPTVASQVTRSADAASMTGTNFSSWYNQGEGTVYFETLTTTAGTDKYNFEIGDGTANNRISALSQSSNQDAYVIVNGSVVANANLAISRASSIRGAIGFKVNDIRSAFNGSLGAADTSATIPSVNALYLGSARSALVPLNGTIAKIAYYPLRVTNAQLQALTS